MPDLLQFHAKICYTAGGMMIHQDKVLLIKHKKLGIWLCPGGHMEENELPHQAAEREFWEETGLKVRAIDPHESIRDATTGQYFPNPLESHLHWISQENYQARVASTEPEKRVATKLWPKGCEQHMGFLYLVEPTGGVDFQQNVEETDGIAWFTQAEVEQLDDVAAMFEMKAEVAHGFAAMAALKN